MKTLCAATVMAVKFYSSQTAHELVFGGEEESWNNTDPIETEVPSFLSAGEHISAMTTLTEVVIALIVTNGYSVNANTVYNNN